MSLESNSVRPACRHCSLPCAPGESFCCFGCETVFLIIQDHHLEDFYKIKSQAQERSQPATVRSEEYRHFDHPDFQGQYVRTESEDSLVSLILEGVHCSACVWLVERLPSILNGVQEARLNFSESRLFLRFDAQRVSLSKIAETLNSFGYAPRPLDQNTSARGLQSSLLKELAVAAFCAGNSSLIAVSLYQGAFTGIDAEIEVYLKWMSFLVALPAVLYSARPFYRAAISGLKMKVAHMDLPISVAIICSFGISVFHVWVSQGEVYFDSVTALIFLLLSGRWLQSYFLNKARIQARKGNTVLPAWAETADGGIVPALSLKPLQRIRIKIGAVIPADGIVLAGESSVDRSLLTGESQLFPVQKGDRVLAGTTNSTGELEVEVRKTARQSELGKIEDLMKAHASKKPAILQRVDRLSAGFTVAILSLAGGTLLFWWLETSIFVALDRVVALLVVACPCALGLATPLALSMQLSRLTARGILVKSADVLERLTRIRTVVFDKTGTLTEGRPRVIEEAWFEERSQDYVEKIVVMENQFRHPIADALVRHLGPSKLELPSSSASFSVERLPGVGVQSGDLVIGSGTTILSSSSAIVSGSSKDNLESARRFQNRHQDLGNTTCLVAERGRVIAGFALSDAVRSEAGSVLRSLSPDWELWVFSGDHQGAVDRLMESLPDKIPLKNRIGNLKPQDKLSRIEALQSQKDSQGVVFIGDGLNDSLALSAASVGIGLTGGATLSLTSAPVFFSRPDLNLLPHLLGAAEQTRRVINRNLIFALLFNSFGVTAAFFGWIDALGAAILMPLSSLVVIVSSWISREAPVRER